MSLYINSINEDEIITSYNFARNSDVVFSEIVTKEQFEDIKSDDLSIIEEDDKSIFYINKSFELKENDVIFTNSYFLEPLFLKLQDSVFKNIKVISTQTDHYVDKKTCSKIPKSVSFLYSTNIIYRSKFLKSIPLGIANNYSTKNLHKSDFKNFEECNKKIKQIYVNFEINTNYFHRNKLKKLITGNDLFYIEDKKLDNLQYLKKLNEFQYVLTPWGNGIDSHRIWETLYAGSFPLIPNHYNFKSIFNSDDFLFDNFKNLSDHALIENFINYSINNEFLNINYWTNKIKSKSNTSSEKKIETISISIDDCLDHHEQIKIREYRIKKLNTYRRKIHNKLFSN